MQPSMCELTTLQPAGLVNWIISVRSGVPMNGIGPGNAPGVVVVSVRLVTLDPGGRFSPGTQYCGVQPGSSKLMISAAAQAANADAMASSRSVAAWRDY